MATRAACLIGLAILASEETALAASYSDLRCKVAGAISISADGMLRRTDRLSDAYLGKRFSVDRQSGLMVGEIANSNAYVGPEVIDPGSDEDSFSVITVYAPDKAVRRLTVQVFVEAPEKPFLFRAGSDHFLSGTCLEEG